MVRKVFLMIFCVLSAVCTFAQDEEIDVRGRIVDDTGTPAIGAAVMLKGAANVGAVTDVDGKFSLTAPRGGVLQITYLGYKELEVPVAPEINVSLEPDSESLEAAVVSTGMTNIDKRLFTGASDRLEAEDMVLSGVADISRSLEGRAAGVTVQNVSSTFGTAPKIRVRGATSILGNSKPLWVVDGVIIEDVTEVNTDELSSGDAVTMVSSAIAGLNSDDIESINILKDGSATSIYGAKAMAGVIVITTKKGRPGSARINYTGEFTMRLKPSYRDYNVMNSQQQMAVYLDLEEKGWLGYSRLRNGSNGGVYRKMYDALNNYYGNGEFELQNTDAAKREFLSRYEFINTDWFKTLFRPSVQHSHSLSISMGTQRSRFYASLSFFRDPGWSRTDDVKRFTANVNAGIDIGKKVTMNLLINASMRQQVAPGTLSQAVDAEKGTISRSFDINPFSYALNTSRVLRPYDDNGELEYYTMNYAPFSIINELNHNQIDVEVLDSRFQAEFVIKPVRGLEINALGSVRYVKSSQEHQVGENSNMSESYRADYNAVVREANGNLYRDPDHIDGVPVTVLPKGGFYNRTDNQLLNYYFRGMANYNNVFNDFHNVNALVGMEVKSTQRVASENYGYGMQYDRGNVPFSDYLIIKKLIEFVNVIYVKIILGN